MKPYNGSDIHMEYMYAEIFPEQAKEDLIFDKSDQESSGFNLRNYSKCFKEKKSVNFKIKYTLNRLPTFSTKDKYLLDAILKTSENEVFLTQAVKDFTVYHWHCYGQYPIFFGLIAHLTYIVGMIVYIDHQYQ